MKTITRRCAATSSDDAHGAELRRLSLQSTRTVFSLTVTHILVRSSLHRAPVHRRSADDSRFAHPPHSPFSQLSSTRPTHTHFSSVPSLRLLSHTYLLFALSFSFSCFSLFRFLSLPSIQRSLYDGLWHHFVWSLSKFGLFR